MALAAFCVIFAIQGGYRLIAGESKMDVTRGGGEVLFWGAWTAINFLRAYGRTASRLNLVTNVGLALIILSWFMN